MALKYLITVSFLALFVLHSSESSKANVVKITDGNWKQVLEGEWLIKFYAPWCPACKSIAPVWTDLSEWSQELDTSIAEVDVTEEPGLSGRFLVTALPTIYHSKGGVFRRYLGPRTKDDLISLVEEKKYEEITPLSWWQSPNSIPMSVLSWVFKMSMIVRVTHTILTEDYGFPAWSSYGFFAVATIFLGLLLGTILVLIADCFWPVKGRPGRAEPQPQPVASGAVPVDGRKKKEEEEEEEEEKEEEEAEVEKEKEEEGGERMVEERGDQEVRKRKTEKESEQTT